MLARVNTIALEGVRARAVEVEVDLASGLPTLSIVGMPETAVREAKDRVRAALANSGFQVPAKRVTINLAPADLPKVGSGYDLPMALGLLAAMDVIPMPALSGRIIVGELALDGRVKPANGCLPAALLARELGCEEVIIPASNAPESALAEGVRAIGAQTLMEVVAHLRGDDTLTPHPPIDLDLDPTQQEGVVDLIEVKGQESAKRALEICAAGGHNLIMTGPPGSGKTLLARCLPGILPALSIEESLDVTAVYSVAGRLTRERPLVRARPFRSPHHTASQVALVGGGGVPKPGEVSLAHRGVLFLDEIPEFNRNALEVLREPLESGDVTVSRAARSVRFPARFQLVAACNPCPCGYLGDGQKACVCSAPQVERYRSKLSGPLLDRIDLHVQAPAVPFETLAGLPSGEPSATVRARVTAARVRQQARQGGAILNAHLSGSQLDASVALDGAGRDLLALASRKLGFSARGFHRILRVARTVADLDGADNVSVGHLSEAIQLRQGFVQDAPA
ncbi:YifB family Mg chelatase-like AAA ATPase [Magnetofaba australis]|uniref:Putative Mg chelatase subunit ChlI n=1 Tax=Magnetofaba australis IT-1 TaxID=1434232 RepID=A0A1Y2K395_9PROT|nr:YifB family Mg chelatase-like AAA ATPase [Magnetofaba australis]OSM02432.1 putative Mg chelatase subunit ChlI [Magnetofaba australis IT-1]